MTDSTAVTAWAKKRIAELERAHRLEVENLKAKLRTAEEAAESARAEKDRALEEVARASSEADEVSQGRADFESREAVALSQASWSKGHAETAQKDRAAAEAKVAELQAALEEARSESEAAVDLATESELSLAEARSNFDELHALLLETEASRADVENQTNAEIHRLRREVRQIPAGFDATFERGSNGLLAKAHVHIGNDTFDVVAIRDAAGHIVEMKREPESKTPEVVKTALSHSASRAAKA
jgi:chromosome segregation ATPase